MCSSDSDVTHTNLILEKENKTSCEKEGDATATQKYGHNSNPFEEGNL